MFKALFDNSWTRRLGEKLEDHDDGWLGIRNTMWLSRAFNYLKNTRQRRHRKHLYRHYLADLIRENGPVLHPAPRLADGWAIDRTHSLPHLSQMIADAAQIIRERGGVKRGSGPRAFFQQILTDEDVARFPSILDFGTSTAVLETVIDHMKQIPVLSVAKPPGVRLNESDKRFDDNPETGWKESQLFHRDYHDSPMVYMIVALRDLKFENGPFCLLPASTSRVATRALRYGRRGRSYRVTDKEIYSVVPREDLIEFTCPAGTVLFLDSSECFHYGSRDAIITRYMMMYAYVTVCRSDFGDVLRKESLPPLQPGAVKLKYPVSPSSSQLRRLVLDREYLVPSDALQALRRPGIAPVCDRISA